MQRRKGATAERDVVSWLRDNGFPDARRYLAGDGRQPGDVDGVAGVAIEIKNQRTLALPAWLRQAEDEARGNLPVVFHKPIGVTDVARWHATTYVEHFVELIRP